MSEINKFQIFKFYFRIRLIKTRVWKKSIFPCSPLKRPARENIFFPPLKRLAWEIDFFHTGVLRSRTRKCHWGKRPPPRQANVAAVGGAPHRRGYPANVLRIANGNTSSILSTSSSACVTCHLY